MGATKSFLLHLIGASPLALLPDEHLALIAYYHEWARRLLLNEPLFALILAVRNPQIPYIYSSCLGCGTRAIYLAVEEGPPDLGLTSSWETDFTVNPLGLAPR